MEEPVNIIPLYNDEPAKQSVPAEVAVEQSSPITVKNAGKKEKITEEKAKKSGGSFAKPLLSVISGNIFAKEEVVKHLPYVLFLAFIALLYIANGYYAEGTVRQLNREGNELKELRSEYITAKSDLMYVSKQSEVAAMSEKKNLGLKESLVPPRKIVVKN